MPEVRVKRRDGSEVTLDAPAARPLMEVLRDTDGEIEGTCGGMCSCGTCHVYIADDWRERLPAQSEDEQMMIEALGDLVPLRPGSRLSCQIEMDDSLSGLTLEIAPST